MALCPLLAPLDQQFLVNRLQARHSRASRFTLAQSKPSKLLIQDILEEGQDPRLFLLRLPGQFVRSQVGQVLDPFVEAHLLR